MNRSFPRRSTLTRTDRGVVRAIAEAMFSEDGEVPNERLEAHVDDVDAFVSAASKTTRFGLRVALFFVRLAPILFFLRLTTLERLPLPERVGLLARLERSQRGSLSLAFIGWRSVMTLVFYEDERELRQLGYGPERVRHRRALPVAVPVPTDSGVRIIIDVPSVGTQAAQVQEVA